MPAEVTSQILAACEKVIGYRFQDQKFLVLALTHASVKSDEAPSNERLEFFGDSVLGMVVAEHLYRVRPGYDEGDCTEVKSAVVSRETLNKVTGRLGFMDFMAMGRGVSRHGEVPVSVGANIYEAIVGAIYLDGGLGHARRFILASLKEEIDSRIGGETVISNAKSTLQQQAQHKLGASPHYRVLREFGASHHRRFEVGAYLQGKEYGRGDGANKKEAEMRAAEAALRTLESGELPAPSAAEPVEALRGRRRRPAAEARPAPVAVPLPPMAPGVVEIPLPAPPSTFGAGILGEAPAAAAGSAVPKKRRRRGRRGGRGRKRRPGAGPAAPSA
jgi:ribonuclease-3